MELQPKFQKVLRAAAGRIVQPTDGNPPGDWRADLAWLILKQLDQAAPEQAQAFAQSLQSLDNESWAIFGYSFATLHGAQQDELLTRVEDLAIRTIWPHPPKEFIEQLVKLTDQAAQCLENGQVVDRPADEPEPNEDESASE